MATSAELRDVERWFVAHGLPYFVDDIREQVLSRLTRPRIVLVLAVAILVGAAAGILVGTLIEPSYGVSTAVSVALGLTAIYAVLSLRAQVIAGWALRRAFRSLGLLLPLLTRALPLLLLFITFLFINAEVWQVSSTLDGGVLWGTVLFFGVAAVLFLVPRLAEELDAFDDSIVSADLMAASHGTPLEAPAQRLIDDDIDLPEEAQVTGLQMVNLVLVLVIAQAVQVLLLAVAVFGFFMVFGAVAIDDTVIESWTAGGGPPRVRPRHRQPGAAAGLGLPRGLLGPLLHRLRGHRRALPQGVLHHDHERAPPGRRSTRRLPGAARRAGTGGVGPQTPATVTGTPLSAALPETSSRSGSVRSLIETPATVAACAIRVPPTWWP